MKLKTSIVKNTNVPTKATILFKNPNSIPTILRVAAAIKAMLEIIKKVAPPFAATKLFNQTNSPSYKIVKSGITLPPFMAKFTELKIPPKTKKNKNSFMSDLFNPLRIFEGLTARSVILTP